ncbi:hypothetical protein MMC22_004813 [Lobaria immixta]|nr:hypothetical protein [Lobaria immixta]
MPHAGDTDPVCTPKASVLHGAQDLRLEEQSVDPPGPVELQIATRSTGICGSDLHYHRDYRNGDLIVKEPLILGHESAGLVIGIDAWREDITFARVYASGVLPNPSLIIKELCKTNSIIPPPGVTKIVSYELGAILEPLGVAMHATKRAQMIEGGSTLIFGAGAVGLLCGAMSRVAGSGKVVITDILAERVDFAVKNGFAHAGFVVPGNYGQNIDEKLESAREIARLACQMQTTNGEPPSEFERVFECTGVEACTQSAIYATRAGGKAIIVGMGTPIQTLPLAAALSREVDIVGTFRYANTYPSAISLVASNNPMLPDLERLVTHRFHGLERAPAAFEMAGKASDEQGNLVLKVVIKTGEE